MAESDSVEVEVEELCAETMECCTQTTARRAPPEDGSLAGGAPGEVEGSARQLHG